MKTAKEMFEELDFYLDIETNNEQIVYNKDIQDKTSFGYIDSEIIVFEKNSKEIFFTNKDFITYNELQAINKQVEELGG